MEHSQNKSHSLISFISSFVLGLFFMFILLSIFIVMKSGGASDAASLQLALNKLLEEELFRIQIIQQLSLFGLPPLFYAIYKQFNFYKTYKIDSFPSIFTFIWGIGFAISIFPLMSFLEQLIIKFPWPAQIREMADAQKLANESLLTQFLNINSSADFILAIVTMGVFAGFFEELFFRGAIQTILFDKLKNHRIAILITGITFGVFHQNFYQFIPIAFIGILFGIIFYRSQNLWVTIFIHIFYNSSQVVLYYLHKINVISFDIDNSESFPIWIVLISIICSSFTFYKLYSLKIKATHE